MKNFVGTNDYYPKNLGSISYSDNSNEDWQNYRKSIIESRTKSQDDFEKYLNIFSSGGLLIGLTILGKLVETANDYEFEYFVSTGSVLFVVSILSNVFSHYKAISNDDKTISEIDVQDVAILIKIDKRNKTINKMNIVSLSAIILGSSLLILFLILNI
ncbi:hypothetical protein [Frigoriflavimonas asaccharolytica]|uniref:Uncharacterized protein n=1 Tax=Frigoriflavimonas asaccharolytica TaxID=2735899 RepID=A0A8J8K9W6_9FLAO|nr:hypothetical protein [Frigoriflavimonas asaccharolytica]NRS94096.1 hypothetical protein [Frigoriflavimonas asaccharolytica]